MIAYLLHQMPEAERAAFEERWFTEPEIYQRLQMAEAELLDDYARGKVSRGQRRRIERYLLGSEFQRGKMAFAMALTTVLPQPKTPRLRWTAVVAAALVASLAVSLWLGWQNRRLQNEVAQLQHAPQPAADGVYTVGLPSDTLRGASTENAVRLPAGIRLLRLELELPPGEQRDTYSATVLAGSRALWSEGPLHPEGRGPASVATIWIPATILGPGDQTVRLDAAAGSPIAYYRFTIIR
jgi:hypothetical protein